MVPESSGLSSRDVCLTWKSECNMAMAGKVQAGKADSSQGREGGRDEGGVSEVAGIPLMDDVDDFVMSCEVHGCVKREKHPPSCCGQLRSRIRVWAWKEDER